MNKPTKKMADDEAKVVLPANGGDAATTNSSAVGKPSKAHSIASTDRYKLIFDEHRYASDFRVRIVQGMCFAYAALAAAFAWAHTESKQLGWLFPAAGAVITVLLWLADLRIRSAIRASKDVGAAIEEKEIDDPQSYFLRLGGRSGAVEQGGFDLKRAIRYMATHSFVVDAFTLLVVVALGWAAWFLWHSNGALG